MPQKVLVKEKKAEALKTSANEREKLLDAAIGKRLNDPRWVEKTKERELEAFDLRTRVGQLSGELYKAEKAGNAELASGIRRKKAGMLEKLSKI